MPSEWNWLNGIMDDVRIYNRALTEQEIRGRAGILLPVGGIAEYPQLAPKAAAGEHGSSASSGALAGAVVGGAVMLAAGGWYARRRWRAD